MSRSDADERGRSGLAHRSLDPSRRAMSKEIAISCLRLQGARRGPDDAQLSEASRREEREEDESALFGGIGAHCMAFLLPPSRTHTIIATW
jgi:hypothetical protein